MQIGNCVGVWRKSSPRRTKRSWCDPMMSGSNASTTRYEMMPDNGIRYVNPAYPIVDHEIHCSRATDAAIRHLGFARATVNQRCVGCHYMPLLGEATHPSFKVQLATPGADGASERMLKKS
jgi:hypothetical protein